MIELLNKISGFELLVLDFISENLTNPILDMLMSFASALCNHGEIWIAVALFMLCFRKTRKAGLAVILSLILGYFIGNLTLKPMIARIRPYELSAYQLIISKPSDFSFPSGHALASFESAFAIYLNNKKFGIYALILASVISFSRLYLYVHYPTDIIAGIVLGILIAVVSNKLTNKYIFFSK